MQEAARLLLRERGTEREREEEEGDVRENKSEENESYVKGRR